MRRFLFLIVLLTVALFGLAPCSSAQVCKPGEYDMLEWMAPWQPVQNSHFNVLEPLVGKFYWVKGDQGFPWDVDKFDNQFIYQLITEQFWGDDTTYKIFEKPLKWMPRCIDAPVSPNGKIASIQVPASDTNFDIHSSCKSFVTRNLGYVVNEIWGPFYWTIGGNLPPNTQTLLLSYRYNCDSQYSNCTDKETFAMQHGPGLVQWTHYVWKNGTWEQVNQTTSAYPQTATVAPVHPCWQ